MEYVTVYATTDINEVAVVKSLFERKNIHLRVSEGGEKIAGGNEHYFQVVEDDRKVARKLLHESGYLRIEHPTREASGTRGKKWMFIFLAALVLILVAILIGWFMTAP
jgi:hypothetical protein